MDPLACLAAPLVVVAVATILALAMSILTGWLSEIDEDAPGWF